jgi:hypothetical protein
MEIWKDIRGFEGKYQISNYGRVKSLARFIGKGAGYLKPEKIITTKFDQDGYAQIRLVVSDRMGKTFKIHRLVVLHFISEIPVGKIVCHKDGDKLNNQADNLYVGCIRSNTLDKYQHGSCKLTIEQTRSVRRLASDGVIKQKEIAKIFNVQQSVVSRIKNGIRGKFID